MTNQKDKSDHSTLNRDRRDFINRVGKASLSVPATALLVSVANKRAHAEKAGYDSTENWESQPENWESQSNGEPGIRT